MPRRTSPTPSTLPDRPAGPRGGWSSIARWSTIARRSRGGSADRVLQCSALTFDASVEEVFAALLGGAALVIHPEDLLTVDRFVESLDRQGVTMVYLPPAFWRQWTDALDGLPLPASLR